MSKWQDSVITGEVKVRALGSDSLELKSDSNSIAGWPQRSSVLITLASVSLLFIRDISVFTSWVVLRFKQDNVWKLHSAWHIVSLQEMVATLVSKPLIQLLTQSPLLYHISPILHLLIIQSQTQPPIIESRQNPE